MVLLENNERTLEDTLQQVQGERGKKINTKQWGLDWILAK